jgi:hypothetical protein
MSVQIVFRGTLQIRTSDGKNICIEPVDIQKNVQEYDTRRIKILPGSLDVLIDFGGVSNVVFLYVQSDKPVSVKINGDLTDTSQGTNFMFTGTLESPITSLHCSNMGVEIATLLIILG